LALDTKPFLYSWLVEGKYPKIFFNLSIRL
jgi:hypothetical protein